MSSQSSLDDNGSESNNRTSLRAAFVSFNPSTANQQLVSLPPFKHNTNVKDKPTSNPYKRLLRLQPPQSQLQSTQVHPIRRNIPNPVQRRIQFLKPRRYIFSRVNRRRCDKLMSLSIQFPVSTSRDNAARAGSGAGAVGFPTR